MDLRSVYHYRIDWIVSFVAVAHHGGFSAAAKALYRSQPRVSSHVADLERELGTKLLDRSVHPAVLTPEGRALLPHAEEILRRLGVLADMTGGAVRGEVRLGAYPSAAAYLYPLAVRALRENHPRVRLVLREGPSVALGAALTSGDLDLVLRPLLPLIGSDGVSSRLLWREPLVAVFRDDHPLARSPYVRLSQIAALPLISIGESGEGNGRQYETNLAFASAGLTPTITAQTNQPQTLVALVRHGMGTGVTNSLAMTTANIEGVTLVPIADPHCERVVALWWRSDGVASPAVAAVRDIMARLPHPRWPWGAEIPAP
ncbi:LysR family transcriptional regulator [Spongiactinospora rosea]|uniref:LysR family transcriptional regulator n=1 Tax=Spongiactinospora rosea TaxID=2248750 RepID=A0A366LQE0_9ACTN|nr:LysR family transcriptional regulator [Spongiactinospora rosea]RBQ16037.1 LysR family transcriptional regulator [Spongiactinospora rosea]